jgi:hypothetical protein
MSALDVNIVMKDGTAVKANMLGKTSDEIYLLDEGGKTKVIKIADVKLLFNAQNGESMSLVVKPETPPVPANVQNVTNVSVPVTTVVEVPGTVYYYGSDYYYPPVYIGPIWYGPHFYHFYRHFHR